MTSQSRPVKAPITELPQGPNSAHKPKSLSDDQRKPHIIVTECLCEHCTGQYTDTLTQSLNVVCTDPKHSSKGAKLCPEVGTCKVKTFD